MGFLRRVFVSERNVVVLSVSILLILLPEGAWWSVLPLYLGDLGASTIEIGIVYSLFTIMVYGFQFAGGFLSDRYGRKLLIALSTFCLAPSFLVAGMAWTWTLTTVGILLYASFYGVQQPAVTSTVTESVDDKRRGTAFGMVEFFMNFGFVIGPLIGGALIPVYGYAPFFYATALACVVCGFLRLFLLKETLPDKSHESKLRFTPPKLDKNLLFFILGCCLFAFTGGLLEPLFAGYAQEVIGLSFAQVEVMFSVAMVAMLIASIPSGKLVERIGAKKSLAIAFVIVDLTAALWAFSRSFDVSLLVMFLSSMFVVLNFVGYNALISELTATETRGTVIGFSSLMLGISTSIGAFAGPLLWVSYTPATPYIVTGIIGIPSALLLAKVKTSQKIG